MLSAEHRDALRALHRSQRAVAIGGVGTFQRVSGAWKHAASKGPPDALGRAIRKQMAKHGSCDIVLGRLYTKETKALGGGKGKRVLRFDGHRAAAIHRLERIEHPDDQFVGSLGFTFRRRWTAIDPLLAAWSTRLASAVGHDGPVEITRVLDLYLATPRTDLYVPVVDCLEAYTGGVNASTKGVDWIDGLATAVARLEAQDASGKLGDEAAAIRKALLTELQQRLG